MKQDAVLDKPCAGWSHIQIGSWRSRCSYIDDVPMMLLDAFLFVLRNHRPVAVKFDAEGYEFIIVLDEHDAFIISDEHGDYEYFHEDISAVELGHRLVRDIWKNLSEWTNWDAVPHDWDVLNAREQAILRKCDSLDELTCRK